VLTSTTDADETLGHNGFIRGWAVILESAPPQQGAGPKISAGQQRRDQWGQIGTKWNHPNRAALTGFSLACPHKEVLGKLRVRDRYKSATCTNGLILLTLLNILQLLLYIGLLALVGQGFLYLISGQGRDSNMFYQLFQILNKPWVWLARRISPSKVADHQVPFVAFFAMGVAYLAVTLAKIEHCVDVAMQGCR
jgi:hypothetical protein